MPKAKSPDRVPDVVPELVEGEPATLAQINTMFLRHSNPLVFGNAEERAEAVHSEARAAMEKAERQFLDAQAVQESINHMHDRELARLRREQGIEETAPAPEMSAEDQAALASLAALADLNPPA